jgi:hypothetical protein
VNDPESAVRKNDEEGCVRSRSSVCRNVGMHGNRSEIRKDLRDKGDAFESGLGVEF